MATQSNSVQNRYALHSSESHATESVTLQIVQDVPLISNVNEPLKRLMDLILCTTMLAVFLPVMVLTAIVLKLNSPNEPIIFRQDRIGRHHKLFTILKFRTMKTNAEFETGPIWSSPEDNRVTPLGKFLRKTHLDELPQLINVLRGEMALIGPRPERPCFVEQFRRQGIPHYEQRHDIRGGITGYAQILCPTPTLDEITDKTESDLYYLQNWSVGLDCWIAYKTALHMLRGVFNGIGLIARRIVRA